MNPIQQLRNDVQEILPDAHGDLDVPKDPAGRWFLDLKLAGRHVVVEWQATEKYFGVSRLDGGDHGYGEKADQVTQHYSKAVALALHYLVLAR